MRSNRGIWVLFATIALVAPSTQAQAQPAEAIGKPLPEAALRDGTVSVRVVAGDRSKPVSGTDVTLMMTPADGTSPASEVRARTDADGRATFSNVAPDAMVQAKVTGEAGDVTSSRFPMPAAGGIKLLLSTLPFAGTPMPPMGGGAGPMGGGAAGGPAAGGPMSPRSVSGTARPEPGLAPDTVTVRLSYDDLADPTPPKDHPVLLVGYRFDLAVAGTVVKTDPVGRVSFDGLDRRGATSYFAMTLLPRGDDFDRLVSEPVLLGGDVGQRLILSGDKRAVGVPVDDQSKLDPQGPTPVPAGEVRVALAGVVTPGDRVELVDALTGKVLVTTKATPPAPNADSTSATWGTGADDPVLAIGALAVSVSANSAPAEGATVEVRRRTPVAPAPPASPAAPPVAEAQWRGTVGANGETAITGLPVGVELDLIVTVDGMAQAPRPVTLPASGGRREQVAVAWQMRGQASARFTGVEGGPERAYLVRAYLGTQACLSAPFMMPRTRGVSSIVLVYPRIIFGFSLTSWVDDLYLGVRGTFSLRNSSLAPYLPGTISKREELVIPLPKGFLSATVRQDFQEAIGVDPTRGFIIRQPVPPGGMGFIAAFSMKTDGGKLRWDMALPFGTLESGIEIKRTADMELDLPPRTRAREVKDERGSWYVVSPISVQPEQRMIFTLEGLPQLATWTRFARDGAGVAVLVVLLITVGFLLWRPKKAAGPERSRYDELVDELAGLGESSSPDDVARRERLMDELEALHRAGGQTAAPAAR